MAEPDDPDPGTRAPDDPGVLPASDGPTPEEVLARAAEDGIHCLPVPTPFAVGRINCYLLEDDPLTLIDAAVGTPKENILEVGKLAMDLDRFTAAWLGTELVLTVTEFRILQSLAKRPGHVRTRDQLVRDGYPDDNFVSDRTIDSHIKRLRRKLEDADASFDAIETVYGLGYRFRADD